MQFCVECLQIVDDDAMICDTPGCMGALRAEPLLGKVLDERFKVEGVHGSGGVGMLFRATHLRLGTTVAVKVLDLRNTEESTAQQLQKRFRQEAKLIAKLRHPAIVEISDFGVANDGRSYIVMEFLEGKDLEQEISKKTPLAPPRIEWIMEQICDALAWTHQHGVVHRDIKPANVMLTRLGGEECVKLLDFGVAKILAEGADNKSYNTMVVGTPEYMSTEQFQTWLGPISPLTDIYALGVTLYEMIAGHTPFHYRTFFQIYQSKVNSRIKPLSKVLKSNKWEALDVVIARALACDPKDRQSTVQQFFQEMCDALGVSSGKRVLKSSLPVVTTSPIVMLDGQKNDKSFAHRETVADSQRLADFGLTFDKCPKCFAPLESGSLLCRECGAIAEVEGDPFIGIVVDGTYRIEEKIERSDELLVYRAVNVKLSHDVELSLSPLKPDSQPGAVEKLREKASLSSKLRHSGLISTIDGGYDSEIGAGFIVTEWIEGRDLIEENDQHGLVPLDVVRKRVLAVLETLEFIHQEGVVYGAVNPINVVLINDDEPGRVVLRDLSSAWRATDLSLMMTIGRIGPPQFVPPELLWAAQSPGPYSDVYGVGALAYFCLVGQPPFHSDSAQDVLTRMRSGRMILPSSIDPDRVSRKWEHTIVRAMSKQPGDRFSSASEMSEAVRSL